MKNAPEVEAKYRLLPGQREALMVRLGPPARVLRHRDAYFDVPGRVLRIRDENGKPLLTRKDPSQITADGIKSRHEVEHPIPPEFVPHLKDLIEWLGHRPLLVVEKERLEYDVPGFVVCLDRLDELGPGDFVEIESSGGDQEAMRRLRDDLGLGLQQVERKSYARLVAESREGNS